VGKLWEMGQVVGCFVETPLVAPWSCAPTSFFRNLAVVTSALLAKPVAPWSLVQKMKGVRGEATASPEMEVITRMGNVTGVEGREGSFTALKVAKLAWFWKRASAKPCLLPIFPDLSVGSAALFVWKPVSVVKLGGVALLSARHG